MQQHVAGKNKTVLYVGWFQNDCADYCRIGQDSQQEIWANAQETRESL